MSVFTATPAFLGSPDFKVIDIDPQQVAKGLQEYLKRGSQLTGVSLEDIDRTVYELPASPASVTLVGLIERGMKLFDAIIWLTAGRPTAYPLQVSPTKSKDNSPTMHAIARSVFYTYFFLITQARYPAPSNSTDKPAVANFLRTVMGMNEDQSYYIRMICSFEPQKFNPAWVKHVQFDEFGQEALSRFGLGVAGYRLFGPFKIYQPKEDISVELRNAVTFARTVATSPPTWDVHPLTRKPEVLTSRGNLNKNLSNLILDVFTEEQINEMVSSKMLYSRPKREPNYKNYLTWTPEDNISGQTNIFRTRT